MSTTRHGAQFLVLAALGFYASATDSALSPWLRKSADVTKNPRCNPSAVIPTVKSPKDVMELHPAHVKYVLAMGDSLTAAAFAHGAPMEYRRSSWSAGAGSNKSVTMPHYLEQYSGPLVGPSVGSWQWVQLAPCCNSDPWYRASASWDNQLNAALSGGMSQDWKIQMDHLTALTSGRGFGVSSLSGFPEWTQEQQDDYKANWKVLTVMLGMNDVLTATESCSEDPAKRSWIVSNFRSNMEALFDHLVRDPDNIFQKVYVNLGTLFHTSYLGMQNQNDWWCSMTSSVLKGEFPCMRSGGDLEAKGRLVDELTVQMNEVLVDIASTYDRRRPDFGVNLFRTPANQQIMHKDLRSAIDCFHPTAKSQRILGTALWNSMIVPSRSQPFEEWKNEPECANADTRLVTYSQTVLNLFP